MPLRSRIVRPEWPSDELRLRSVSVPDLSDPNEKSQNLQDLPVRIMLSTAFANSEKMASTSSNPARTVMISALGFVYLFAKTAPRTTVKV